MKNGYTQGDMKPEVKDCQTPDAAFAEKFDQAPLQYKERQDRIMSKEAGKIRSQTFKGRYNT